ncbi:hypothetical protein [Paracoccus luteus]|uniref:hypothetical protein n=1 Tax=Paracoccus luteus TaxID=2508543 RepID=UPI00106F2E85|nr:hypothetical protein [Paracoccus luteus]
MIGRDELLAALPGLTGPALDALTAAGIVRPVQSPDGPRFRPIDEARLTLALELEDAYALDAEALALVLSLIDQVHGLRGEMRAMLSAVAAEPPETRARLREIITTTRVTLRR